MNYRDYKIFSPNHYYHIFNRGVGKMDIFKDEADFLFFLHLIRENLFPRSVPVRRESSASRYVRKTLPPNSYTLICYCLMPNHFHLLVRQDELIAVSKLISKVCTSYSKYFNKKYDRVGHVFQDAFKAVLIESDSQLLWTSAYIHNNPKTADLVKDLKDYHWSSYLDYSGLRQGTLCDKKFILKQFKNVDAYKKFVDDAFVKIKERKDLEYLLLDE
jgi:putative transposase